LVDNNCVVGESPDALVEQGYCLL